ncbi:sensor histidine kinase [Aneurinibacillus tyrosinisolvens]|uniref:sensor histidine kinase n=1 Tax=Aneurinibacillus tyrosinisolvens TaxID=1443435 RepID=UPI000A4169E2|nr:HAMP domain-containing sensor histidine kinase [Aneurinibacillus tyrosinisolvens]
MASSFVHEFRNPLTSVIGFTKLLKQKYAELEYLDIMEHELEQLKYRISQFLLVSRRGDTDRSKKVFLLSELFREVLDFLYPSLVDGDVEVVPTIQPNVYFYGYKEETRQVLINLMINSIDALQQVNTPRKLYIEMKTVGNEIEISVSNNGPCISPNLIQAIFEPFVTTKELGTGIGLFICKKIIEKQNGTISCKSEPSLTTFCIRFKCEETREEGQA